MKHLQVAPIFGKPKNQMKIPIIYKFINSARLKPKKMCKHCCRRARVCFPNIPQQCCANIAKSGCRKGQFFFQAPANNVMPFHFYELPQNSAGTYHNSSTFFCIESKCALNDGANEHSDNSNLQSVCQKLVQAAIKVL